MHKKGDLSELATSVFILITFSCQSKKKKGNELTDKDNVY